MSYVRAPSFVGLRSLPFAEKTLQYSKQPESRISALLAIRASRGMRYLIEFEDSSESSRGRVRELTPIGDGEWDASDANVRISIS